MSLRLTANDLVGEGGFEPPTACSQSRNATTAPLPGPRDVTARCFTIVAWWSCSYWWLDGRRASSSWSSRIGGHVVPIGVVSEHR